MNGRVVKKEHTVSPLALRHHAVLLVGSRDACLRAIPPAHKEGVDVEFITTDILSIEEARSLRVRASGLPIESDVRRFFISCRQILPPAQNALLKLFEDPPKTARFYLILPHAGVLIETMRSRMVLGFSSLENEENSNSLVKTFLSTSYSERLALIADLHKKKDSIRMRSLISSIEKDFKNFNNTDKEKVLKDILLASRYAQTAGASPKMLLEHLAISIPEKMK